MDSITSKSFKIGVMPSSFLLLVSKTFLYNSTAYAISLILVFFWPLANRLKSLINSFSTSSSKTENPPVIGRSSGITAVLSQSPFTASYKSS